MTTDAFPAGLPADWLRTRQWRLYSGDTDEGEAAQAFCQRFGEAPQWVFDGRGGLWAGPLPPRKEDAWNS